MATKVTIQTYSKHTGTGKNYVETITYKYQIREKGRIIKSGKVDVMNDPKLFKAFINEEKTGSQIVGILETMSGSKNKQLELMKRNFFWSFDQFHLSAGDIKRLQCLAKRMNFAEFQKFWNENNKLIQEVFETSDEMRKPGGPDKKASEAQSLAKRVISDLRNQLGIKAGGECEGVTDTGDRFE
jgi:hypothetical protein